MSTLSRCAAIVLRSASSAASSGDFAVTAPPAAHHSAAWFLTSSTCLSSVILPSRVIAIMSPSGRCSGGEVRWANGTELAQICFLTMHRLAALFLETDIKVWCDVCHLARTLRCRESDLPPCLPVRLAIFDLAVLSNELAGNKPGVTRCSVLQ
ncbi:hypothetical protein KC342_g47 [Hortaea werneckii]|nr:hypothetical protein KC342_g47 [Hortaea werneckii]